MKARLPVEYRNDTKSKREYYVVKAMKLFAYTLYTDFGYRKELDTIIPKICEFVKNESANDTIKEESDTWKAKNNYDYCARTSEQAIEWQMLVFCAYTMSFNGFGTKRLERLKNSLVDGIENNEVMSKAEKWSKYINFI